MHEDDLIMFLEPALKKPQSFKCTEENLKKRVKHKLRWNDNDVVPRCESRCVYLYATGLWLNSHICISQNSRNAERHVLHTNGKNYQPQINQRQTSFVFIANFNNITSYIMYRKCTSMQTSIQTVIRYCQALNIYLHHDGLMYYRLTLCGGNCRPTVYSLIELALNMTNGVTHLWVHVLKELNASEGRRKIKNQGLCFSLLPCSTEWTRSL